ncbi:hypothetical protein XF24_00210 [candidate division SR1 bacterium Aalborg_AAW-1]|nr:hypothetical protein XF24_00210 [candidate division SR1 bacterium Aalborg_AAW-1]
MLLKKYALIMVLLIGMVVFSGQYSAAQSNPLCSITLRGSSTISLQSLFPGVDKNKFDFNGRDNQIEGSTSWHDNFANCNNGTIFESSSWGSFWSKNIANVSTWTAGTSYNSNVKQSDVVKLQTYINSKCSLGLTPDGKIGIKTLNAAMICNTLKESGTSNLPTDGTQNGSTTNGGTQNSTICEQKFTTLFEQVKSNVKVESNQCCYINTSSSSSNSSWQLSADKKQATYSSISIPVCTTSSAGDGTANGGQQGNGADNSNGGGTPNAPTASCFKNPLPNGYNYTNNFTWNGEGQGDGCSCKSGYKKITKQIQNDKGVQDTVSVCEKCDPKKCNCGIKLNTNIPFIGRCIMYGNTNNTGLSGDVTTVNSVSAFPILMGAIIRILVSAILLVCFGTLIVGGFMMTVPDQYKTGKGLVMKVVYTIAALGSLGIILYLVNPNFFK